MLLKKIIKKIFGIQQSLSNFDLYRNQIEKHPSTITTHCNVRFDVPHKLQQRNYITIGQKGIINAQFIFESEQGQINIGNNVHIGGAQLICRNSITIMDDVTMAWGITIYDHNSHSIHWEHRQYDNAQCYNDYMQHNGNNVYNKNWTNVDNKPIVIHAKVWIGFDVTILKGVTIGEGAVIGAKAVVTKNVAPYTVVAGNPAVIVKQLN